MTTVRNRDIAVMTDEAMDNRLKELQDELLMLRAEQALGGSPSNPGEIRATRRSIARLKTHMRMRRTN